jgi:N utilization substance protein B
MGVRRRGRELALQMLYQREIAGGSADDVIAASGDLQQVPEGAREFAVALVRGVLEHGDAIDGHLKGQADNWRVARMAAVDRNILRLALFELIYQPATPAAVVIDEAIELAKRFGSERSSQFVNGILDGFLHRHRPAAGDG